MRGRFALRGFGLRSLMDVRPPSERRGADRNANLVEVALAERCACLLYLASHGDVDAIRHDVVSIVVAGERQARLRHFIGAWQWAESKE